MSTDPKQDLAALVPELRGVTINGQPAMEVVSDRIEAAGWVSPEHHRAEVERVMVAMRRAAGDREDLQQEVMALEERIEKVEAEIATWNAPNAPAYAARIRSALDGPGSETSGEVGTGAGEGAPRQLISVPTLDAGSAWVTRSEDCPEAPVQAHLPVFDGPVAGTCRACGQDLVHEPGERTYHPWDVKWPEGKCPELLPLDEHTDALSTRVPDSQFIPDRKRLPEDVTRQAMAGGFPPHDDGRLCMYHARLGKWTFDGLNECLRAHPDPDAAKGDVRG